MTLDQVRNFVINHRARAILGVGRDIAGQVESVRLFVNQIALELVRAGLDAGTGWATGFLLLRQADETVLSVQIVEADLKTVTWTPGEYVDAGLFIVPNPADDITLQPPAPSPGPIDLPPPRQSVPPPPPSPPQPFDFPAEIAKLHRHLQQVRSGVEHAMQIIASAFDVSQKQLGILGDELDLIKEQLARGFEVKTRLLGIPLAVTVSPIAAKENADVPNVPAEPATGNGDQDRHPEPADAVRRTASGDGLRIPDAPDI